MRVRVRVLPGWVQCMVGYTVIQSFDVIEKLKPLMAGSYRATIPMSCLTSMLLLKSVCWQVGDLLTFCCQITNLSVGRAMLQPWGALSPREEYLLQIESPSVRDLSRGPPGQRVRPPLCLGPAGL